MRVDRSGRLGIVLLIAVSFLAAGQVVAQMTGELVVRTEADAAILWDDALIGVTNETGSLTISRIPLGDYSITLQKDGFETVSRTLRIDAGRQTLEIILLKQPPSTSGVESGPASRSSLPSQGSALPDPFGRGPAPVVSLLLITFLVAVAVGALWLGRRRGLDSEDADSSQSHGPRVVLANHSGATRRQPGFYEDLRKRETMLENLGERGGDRRRPKVIELPAAEDRAVKGEP